MVFEKLFMKILNKERKPKQISILIIGLNNSGKSSIVNFFKNKDDRKSISVPTVGFNIEHFESKLNNRLFISRDFDLPQHWSETSRSASISIIYVSLDARFHSFRFLVCFADQGVSFTAYDMAGIGRYRNLWEHHFKTCHGVE
jgi:ADP-ribosylation factor-like protein 6